jgi:predicted dithiol-disulfide oxidoreductase (DUF899 family)
VNAGDDAIGCSATPFELLDGIHHEHLPSGGNAELRHVELKHLLDKASSCNCGAVDPTDVKESLVSDIPFLDIPTSEDYRKHRIRLLEAELDLRNQREQVAELRRALPPGPVIDVEYVFDEGDPDLTVEGASTQRRTRLAELFDPGQNQLFIYHMMFGPDWDQGCRMCSMWLDGLNGVAKHIRETASFAVIAKAELPKLRAWARHRGWTSLRLLSSHGTTFNQDMRVEDGDGEQHAGVSVLTREADHSRSVLTGAMVSAGSPTGWRVGSASLGASGAATSIGGHDPHGLRGDQGAPASELDLPSDDDGWELERSRGGRHQSGNRLAIYRPRLRRASRFEAVRQWWADRVSYRQELHPLPAGPLGLDPAEQAPTLRPR